MYWEVDTGKILKTLPGPRFGFSSVALSPDERGAATHGSDGLTLWDIDAEIPIRRVDVGFPIAIRYASDGTSVITLSDDDRVCRTEVRGRSPPRCSNLDAGQLDAADMGDELSVAGERYGELGVWSIVTGRKIARWQAHSQAVNSVAFMPTLSLAASAGGDHVIRVWNTKDGNMLHERKVPGFGTLVALSRDGTRVLYGTESGEIHVWNHGRSP